MEEKLNPEEELAQYFYEKLVNKDSQPAVVLVQFYCKIYERDFDAKLIPFFSRMVKMYGRNNMFLVLLDLFDFEEVNHDNIHRLIAYLAKKRIAGKFVIQENVDLSNVSKDYLKELKKLKKQNLEGVENPFDE